MKTADVDSIIPYNAATVCLVASRYSVAPRSSSECLLSRYNLRVFCSPYCRNACRACCDLVSDLPSLLKMGRAMRHSQNQTEPPSTRVDSSLFLIGQDAHGHWVVRDQFGLRGGLFVSRAEALKFARFESVDRPHRIMIVPEVLELTMSGDPHTPGTREPTTHAALRWVA